MSYFFQTPGNGNKPAGSDDARMLGSNQVGMREHNERVLLQALRLHGPLPKADLARLTQLSTQTASVIVDRLLKEGMVMRLESLRGKVGQPSRPIALRPDAAFSVGVRLGRRSLDMLVLDFVGAQRWQASSSYAWPDVDAVFALIAGRLDEIHAFLGEEGASRLVGIGLAAPLSFEGWQELLGGAPGADAWARVDVRERLQAMTPLPVAFAKDTAAACVAELVAGRGRALENYLYIYIDVLVGGGLVIEGQPHGGRHGNAGAVGSMPLGLAGRRGGAGQVLEEASLVTLEAMFAQAGLAPVALTDPCLMQEPRAALARAWIARAADAIAFAIGGAACVLDLEAVIIDGAAARGLLDALLREVEAALQRYDWRGVVLPRVLAGDIGPDAKVRGAAFLPLHGAFAPAPELFLKAARR